MLPELSEADATGDVATIYREIREFCGVAYVSSLQRHLATRPGWLEWAWHAVRPAFASGAAQHAAWRACVAKETVPFAPLSRHALSLLGVDEADTERLRNVCQNFVRVSPTNLLFSGIAGHFMRGTPRPSLPTHAAIQTPALPSALPPPESMVAMESASPPLRAMLMDLGTQVDGHPFVPGLYRMLANWPACFAHLGAQILQRMQDPATASVCAALREASNDAALSVYATLQQASPPPSTDDIPAILAAMDRYRVTSPEMILYGTLIRDALPRA